MHPPRIVFFGSDAICLPALEYLRGAETCPGELACVVSQPDRARGRGRKTTPNAVSEWAEARGVPLRRPEKPDAALAEALREEGVALALVMAYGHFLPKALREAPARGMLNFHASLLPAYRGASPVEGAVASGDRETGVCLMRVVREMDAGDVAGRERVCIEESDTSVEVREKIARATVPLLERHLGDALAGALRFEPQGTEGLSFTRRIRKADGLIDFRMTPRDLVNRWRALQPWPGGMFDRGEVRIKVGRAAVAAETGEGAPDGTVVSAGGVLRVAAGGGAVDFGALQRPGGRMLPAAEFLRGLPIREGERLTGGEAEPLVREEP